MDFSLSDEQLAYRKTIIEFAHGQLSDDVVARDRASDFSREAFRRCAEFGLQGLPVPEQYGGSGADAVTIVVAMEALGFSCPDSGLIFSINAQMWSFELPLLEFGTEAQKCRYLPALCRGETIGVHAITESDAGSDAFNLRATAEKKGCCYVLNGAKTFITNAPVADAVLVFATLDRSKGIDGISVFIVDRGTPGLEVSAGFEKMGLRTSPIGQVILNDCEIPEANRLGPEGAGIAIFNASMEWERAGILASYLGTMERQIQTCVRYARCRKQFGKPIGSFQAVAHRIANMKVRLEASRWLVYRVAWLKQRHKRATLEAAVAKLHVSESLVQSCLDAIQIHGAYGYMTEAGIERDMRDSIASTLYSGTSEIQRNLIAASLGLPRTN